MLARRARGGDAAALEGLVTAVEAPIRRLLAARLAGQPDDVLADCAQEALARVVDGVRAGRAPLDDGALADTAAGVIHSDGAGPGVQAETAGGDERVLAWTLTVAYRAALNHLRSPASGAALRARGVPLEDGVTGAPPNTRASTAPRLRSPNLAGRPGFGDRRFGDRSFGDRSWDRVRPAPGDAGWPAPSGGGRGDSGSRGPRGRDRRRRDSGGRGGERRCPQDASSPWPAAEAEELAPTRRALCELAVAAQAALPRGGAELVWARVVGGASWPDLARDLGTSAAAAKRRFQRAQVILRRTCLRAIDALPAPERAAARAHLGLAPFAP